MDLNIITLIIAVAALVVGIIAGKFIFAKDTRKRIEEAELQAQTLIKEAQLRAETVRKEKELEAKERFVQLKAEHEREVLENGGVTFHLSFHAEFHPLHIGTSAYLHIKSVRPKLILVQKPTLVNLKLLFCQSVQKVLKLLFLRGF